jgi:hypothetical protein
MTTDGTAKDDVKVPDSDMGKEIQTGFDDGKDLLVTIVSAMGEEQVRFLSILLPSVVVTLYRPSPSRRHRRLHNRICCGPHYWRTLITVI